MPWTVNIVQPGDRLAKKLEERFAEDHEDATKDEKATFKIATQAVRAFVKESKDHGSFSVYATGHALGDQDGRDMFALMVNPKP